MEVTELKLDLHAVSGDNTVMAVKCVPHFPWDAETNARSKEQQGVDVTVVCAKREFAKFVVHVMGGDYDKLFVNGVNPLVSFENFEAYFYRDFRNNEYVLKATAAKMVPVPATVTTK